MAGACPGLTKWVGWARGQKWFEVPLPNMEAVGGESHWERGHCLLFVQHLTPKRLDPLLGFLGNAFMLKVASLTVVLWECIKRQLIF